MKRVVASAVVLSLVSWLVPGVHAQAFSPAGLISGLSGMALSQPKIEQPKDIKEVKPQPPEIKDQPAKGQPKVDPKPQPKDVLPQPKVEVPQPKVEVPPAKPLAAQPLAQQYYERTITCYKPVFTEREVQQVVTKLVPREEKFTYTVFVPVMREVKRTETFYVPVQKPVEYTITVMVPVTTKEKRKITECTLVQQEVNVNYTVLVPKMTQQKRMVGYTELERRLVEQTVPVCRVVMVPAMDCCGNCYTVCRNVIVPQKVTQVVCVPVHKTKEILVNVVVCEQQQRVGKSYVCKPVYKDREILVDVTHCVAEKRKVSGTVCEMVPKTRDVVYQVQECVAKQQAGTRTVYDCQAQTVTRKVQCLEMVPFTTLERIPIIVSSCCRPCW